MSDAGGSPLVGTDTPGLAVPDVTPVLSDWWNWAARNRADLLGQIAEAGPHTLEELRSAPGDLSNPMLMAFGGPGSIKGFHGTAAPPFDAFSNEFIGSGEGAQAFGWGHYVAGNPKIAEGYQEALAGRSAVPADEAGNPLGYMNIAKKYYEPGSIVPSYGGNFDKVISFNEGDPGFSQWSVKVKRVVPTDEAIASNQKWGQLVADPSNWRDHAFEPARNHSTYPNDKELTDIGAARGWQMTKPGALLEVHILPEESELLDWDRPLSGQSEEVKQALNDKTLFDPPRDFTGEQFYNWLSRSDEYNKQTASVALHEAGIPGIRYLDAGSRNVYPGMSYNGQIKEVPRFVQTFGQGASSPEEVLSAADREIRLMRQKADFAADQYSKSQSASQWPGSRSIQEKQAIDQIVDMKKARDFIADNMGDFQYKDPRTFNYVIFDPSNLRITARNGQRLIPVDHDPFAGEGSQ